MAQQISFTFRDNSGQVMNAMEDQIRDALTAIGLFVESEAKLRAPVDTGNLRGSIGHKLVDDSEVQIGSDVEYAELIEKGTSRQSAQPYLTPAAEDNVNDIKRLVESYLGRLG